ncbi:MAG: ABC transporter permease [Planctomycetes bacterium]|nr:ABC transporter permease [Planctomycetota bacterium]
MLGMVCGVGSVISMLSVGEGASQEAMEQIRKLGSNNIILQSVKMAADENAGQAPMLTPFGLLYEDDERIRQTMPSVRRTVPAKHIPAEGRLGERAMELRVVGTTPEWFDLVSRKMLAGRLMSWRDYNGRAGVCVLTESGARKLLAGKKTIGQAVRIGSNSYEVIGIIQSEQGGGAIATPDRDTDAYIPLNVARERHGDRIERGSRSTMGPGNQIPRDLVELHQIIVEVNSAEDVEDTAAAIKTMLERFHKKADYRIDVPLALLRQAEATKRTFNIVLGSIAGIGLLVGGIGIMNIMLATVTERTREIGIRRAIGAKRRQIVGQFLIETVVLSSVGGLLGALLGPALAWGVETSFGMATVVTPWSIILSLGISVGVGIIFGIYPAIRAANLDPIEALRHE